MPDNLNLSSTDTIIKSPTLTIEPVGIAQATGKLVQPAADAILDQRQALLSPGLIALVTWTIPVTTRRSRNATRTRENEFNCT